MKALLFTLLRAAFAVGAMALATLGSAHAARLALVIGNDQYQHVSVLRNAVADAQTMADAFRKAGYQVTQATNRDLKSMKDDLRAFRRRIQGGDEVVLFFSGHGVQLGGENFLLPIDVRSDGEDQVRDDAIGLSTVLADIRGAKPVFTLAIVDACRDNPFTQAGKSIGGRGLTRAASATGEMILFAAGEGQRALDRLGGNDPVRNGVFTRVFVKEMERPGVPVDQVMKNVRVEVARLAQSVRHEQVPALYDQVLGTFYFYGSGSASNPGGGAEQQTWARVQASHTAAGYRAYLSAYPQGQYVADARVALALVEAGPAPAPQPQPQPTPQPVQQGLQAGQTAKDCDVCPEMVVIPAGSFTMGSSDGDDDEEPLHRVNIQSFALGKFEVTQGQWKAVMGNNPSRFTECGDNCPVERVSWNDIQEYIQKLNQRSGKTYRLASEAEWEYAARAGSTGKWSFGDNQSQLGEYAWYSANSGKTQRVGQKKPNAFGLYDMHGNVWEWVQDVLHDNYSGAPTDGSAWMNGGDNSRRVLRGGSWSDIPAGLRSANRFWYSPESRIISIGFRLARTVF